MEGGYLGCQKQRHLAYVWRVRQTDQRLLAGPRTSWVTTHAVSLLVAKPYADRRKDSLRAHPTIGVVRTVLNRWHSTDGIPEFPCSKIDDIHRACDKISIYISIIKIRTCVGFLKVRVRQVRLPAWRKGVSLDVCLSRRYCLPHSLVEHMHADGISHALD